LSEQSLSFSQYLLAETNEFFLHFVDEEIIEDLPDYVVEMMTAAAQKRNLSLYCLTLDYPLYI
jgi:peptidyl-dipeptidase Dcp